MEERICPVCEYLSVRAAMQFCVRYEIPIDVDHALELLEHYRELAIEHLFKKP